MNIWEEGHFFRNSRERRMHKNEENSTGQGQGGWEFKENSKTFAQPSGRDKQET